MHAPLGRLAAPLLLSAAAAVAAPAAAQGLLEGTVRTARGAPVACAVVELAAGGHGTVADSLGRYRFFVPAYLARAGQPLALRVTGVNRDPVETSVAMAARMRLDVRVPVDSAAVDDPEHYTCGAMMSGDMGGPPPPAPPPPPPPPPSPMSPPPVAADAGPPPPSGAVAMEGIVVTGVGAASARASMAEGSAVVTAPTARAREGAPAAGAAVAVDSAAAWRQAGILTASVWDDLRDGAAWAKYLDFVARHSDGEAAGLKVVPTTPALLRLTSGGRPLKDHPVTLRQGDRSYRMRTDADGTLRVFPRWLHPLEPGTVRVEPDAARAFDWRLPATDGTAPVRATRAVSPRHRSARPTLQIGLMIDATGSMGDEMEYIQTELRDVIARAIPASSGIDVELAVVYYRDRGDAFVTRSLPFTDDVDEVVAFLGRTEAGGGGDYPEEMNAALGVMLGQEWSPQPAARMLFVVADAPPHPYDDAEYTYQDAFGDAIRQGIAVYPVAASGVDRSTEYLMRALAVSTGGKHIFLTDDSGVGNPHLKPEVDTPPVEKLNELMIREIRAYAQRSFPGRLR